MEPAVGSVRARAGLVNPEYRFAQDLARSERWSSLSRGLLASTISIRLSLFQNAFLTATLSGAVFVVSFG